MMKKVRILIADDHNVVRGGLRILLSAERDFEIVGEAETGSKAIAMAKRHKPDLVLMDVAMPECNGAKATEAITRQSPTSKVLVLSAYQDDDSVKMMLRSGAAGYLTKHTAAQDLVRAVREVNRGHSYFSPSIARRMTKQTQFEFANGEGLGRNRALTGRETQMVKLTAEGLANKQMASELGISIKTVEKHRQAAMDKLDIHDTAGLTRYAIQKGIVSSSAPAIHPVLCNLAAAANAASAAVSGRLQAQV